MSDKLRITGMASGLDTDTMVKQLMKAENMKVDKVKQDRQIVQWQQDLYRDIIGDLSSLRSTYFDVLKPETNMLSANSYAAFDINSSDTTNTIVTAKAGVGALTGNYKVKVNQVAAGAIVEGNALGSTVTRTTKLSDLGMTATSIRINYNDKTVDIPVDLANDTIDKLIQNISDKTSGNVIARFSELTRKFSIQTSATGSSNEISISSVDKLGISSTLSGQINNIPKGTTTLASLGMAAGTKNLAFDISGTPYSVSVTETDSIDSVVAKISALGNGFSASFDGATRKITISNSTDYQITSGLSELGISATTGPVASVTGSDVAKLSNLGMASGSSITFKMSDALVDASVTINSNDTLENVIGRINSTGKFTASLDNATGKLSIVSNSGQSVSIDKDIDVLGIKARGFGQDALVDITPPGSNTPTSVTKATNNFSIDGMSYTVLQKDLGAGVNLTVTPNAQKAFDKIKTFIDKYNDIVEKVNKKTDEKKQYSFKPLTDDQKKDMKEDEIKQWEERAKEGLLKGDSALQGMLLSMRKAFFEGVEGAGISLRDLGMSTSNVIADRGKIVFDPTLGGEQKLKDMLATRGDQVARLFTQTSTKWPSYNPDLTSTQRDERSKQEGIFQKINDVLLDYVRTSRNNGGKKGILIEKAGLKGDFTEYNNLLTKQIQDKDKVINDLSSKLADKENKYYLQFSKLEQAMNNMNSQSSWLSQQLGSAK